MGQTSALSAAVWSDTQPLVVRERSSGVAGSLTATQNGVLSHREGISNIVTQNVLHEWLGTAPEIYGEVSLNVTLTPAAQLETLPLAVGGKLGATVSSRVMESGEESRKQGSSSGGGEASPCFLCPIYGLKFKTRQGLGQHKRHRHPVQLNAERLEQLPKRRGEWSGYECHTVVEKANHLMERCSEKQQLYVMLENELQGRTAEGVKKQLRKLGWEMKRYLGATASGARSAVVSPLQEERPAKRARRMTGQSALRLLSG
ncbi:unnamed protein product [Dicrocoelium dendriticum]|nr:unnamed protein product [Dicrocoelium dendriticum]